MRRVSDTQEQVEGWDQERLARAVALMIGCGGLGSWIGLLLVKMGLGWLYALDPDEGELANLNRQFLSERDVEIGAAKGVAVPRQLSQFGFLGTELLGFPLFFSEFVSVYPEFAPTVGVVGVDNDDARREASAHFRRIERPLVVVGMGREGSSGYVFVQDSGVAAPCLGCYLGAELLEGGGQPCAGGPAVADSLATVCGFAARAVASLAMKRPLAWNLVRVSLESGVSTAAVVKKHAGCSLCGATGGGARRG